MSAGPVRVAPRAGAVFSGAPGVDEREQFAVLSGSPVDGQWLVSGSRQVAGADGVAPRVDAVSDGSLDLAGREYVAGVMSGGSRPREEGGRRAPTMGRFLYMMRRRAWAKTVPHFRFESVKLKVVFELVGLPRPG